MLLGDMVMVAPYRMWV